MTEPTLNYIQLRIPIENSDLVFQALVDQYGIELGGEEALTMEQGARKALIGVVENAVTEHFNREALRTAQENKPQLNIT